MRFINFGMLPREFLKVCKSGAFLMLADSEFQHLFVKSRIWVYYEHNFSIKNPFPSEFLVVCFCGDKKSAFM